MAPNDTDRSGKAGATPDETFLHELNDELRSLEERLSPENETGGTGIFLFGLPRSGTTLLYQLVAYCCDVGYIDNVAARFWRAPLAGIRLSKAIGSRERPVFESRVGRTREATGVHEFGHFWSRLFGYEGRDLREPGEIEDERWRRMEREIDRVHREFGRPVVHKNLVYAFHLPRFQRVVPDSLFLHLERDPVEVGLSILETRQKLYGDRSCWWSFRPSGGRIQRRGLEPEEEVAVQIRELQNRFRRGLDAVATDSVLHLRYREVCEDPSTALGRVAEHLADAGVELSLVREPPAACRPREYPVDSSYRRMEAALEDAGIG